MLKINKLTKQYSSQDSVYRGIRDASFELGNNEIVCILGKSGSGKSTLIRAIAGLEDIDSGTIINESESETSYVAQDYTLWPHMTVLENMVLAPSLRGQDKDTLTVEAQQLLRRFELESYENSYPTDLSGGQRQRVALLRAVMNKSKILFLDEITSALDPELTKGVLDLIRALSKEGYAMLIVTHHVSFALSVADRILFMKEGEIIADESTTQFFMNQSNKEIQSFILDIAKRDENIEIFKGKEQFQAYHLGLLKRLPIGSTIYVAGAVSDQWYVPMGEFYPAYEKLRIEKNITWKMVTYSEGEIEARLLEEQPKLNLFRKMPRSIQNPANYNIFGDTVITQIFEEEPTIIQIKNKNMAEAYLRFFEELWSLSK